jgi:hypothetical protein
MNYQEFAYTVLMEVERKPERGMLKSRVTFRTTYSPGKRRRMSRTELAATTGAAAGAISQAKKEGVFGKKRTYGLKGFGRKKSVVERTAEAFNPRKIKKTYRREDRKARRRDTANWVRREVLGRQEKPALDPHTETAAKINRRFGKKVFGGTEAYKRTQRKAIKGGAIGAGVGSALDWALK